MGTQLFQTKGLLVKDIKKKHKKFVLNIYIYISILHFVNQGHGAIVFIPSGGIDNLVDVFYKLAEL
jgi:hypothetical protein